ncbi:MAG: hypothetical protein FJY54_06910 [Betaproteobacteria bacterium]|nr:hypothetical protein [Betaproteobacteria bacterium]
MIPCYVSGAGMYAGERTWSFKTTVIAWLEGSGLGYDTRYRYYRARFPELDPEALARLVCDPIEHYDRDWPRYRAGSSLPEEEALAHFVLERDARFRDEARVAIYCFDEAGIGSGVNAMRFVHAGKPIVGFYAADAGARRVNLTNVLQLAAEFPEQVRLAAYRTPGDITTQLGVWLPMVATGRGLRTED